MVSMKHICISKPPVKTSSCPKCGCLIHIPHFRILRCPLPLLLGPFSVDRHPHLPADLSTSVEESMVLELPASVLGAADGNPWVKAASGPEGTGHVPGVDFQR